MGLLLPLLLLGLAQPADQPSAATPQPGTQQLSTADTSVTSKESGSTDQTKPEHPFDRIEPDLRDDCKGDPNCKFVEGPPVCLTMRSYYFERRDDLAPEPVGMTTCESVRDVRNRNAKKGQKARLVPAN